MKKIQTPNQKQHREPGHQQIDPERLFFARLDIDMNVVCEQVGNKPTVDDGAGRVQLGVVAGGRRDADRGTGILQSHLLDVGPPSPRLETRNKRWSWRPADYGSRLA